MKLISPKCKKESFFKTYKFNGQIKFPDKIADDTLLMWFGKDFFGKHSRQQLLNIFVQDVKTNENALAHLWEYSKDAIDNNLLYKKYIGGVEYESSK